MAQSLLSGLALAAAGLSALSIGRDTSPILGAASPVSGGANLAARDTSGLTPGCQNGPNSRKCWGKYDINTNYYDTLFHTGVIREYWFNVEEIDCAPDGYRRKCQVVNGSMPGPLIEADWGDDVVVHVTNNLPHNGTAIHWHGVRQLNNNEYDGSPGATQCPLPPGDSMTYKWHASQYGTSMWHSHFSVQYSMGLHGPIIIHGPSSADYDVDLGTVFMTDWGHETEFRIWADIATFNVTFDGAETGLVNGMNTGNCTVTNSTARDPNCMGPGKKAELVFQPGKKHLIRLINLATEAWFQFSVDQHRMTVMSTDFVPIVPYESDNVLINMGQRYDIVIEADQQPKDYWLRSGFISSCIPNYAAENITGIVRYDNKSTATPSTESSVVREGTCLDESPGKLVPWLPIDVPNMDGGISYENVTGEYENKKYLRWSFNQAHANYMWTNYSNPALGDVAAGNLGNIPRGDVQFPIGAANASAADRMKALKTPEWVVLVLEEITPIPGITHPLHIHGHDMLLLSSGIAKWDHTTVGWQTKNPVRRDTITMPPNGHIALAWPLDNPGIWLFHCHIAWHSSQGFAAALIESPALVKGNDAIKDWDSVFAPMCKKWMDFDNTNEYHMDDSGV